MNRKFLTSIRSGSCLYDIRHNYQYTPVDCCMLDQSNRLHIDMKVLLKHRPADKFHCFCNSRRIRYSAEPNPETNRNVKLEMPNRCSWQIVYLAMWSIIQGRAIANSQISNQMANASIFARDIFAWIRILGNVTVLTTAGGKLTPVSRVINLASAFLLSAFGHAHSIILAKFST